MTPHEQLAVVVLVLLAAAVMIALLLCVIFRRPTEPILEIPPAPAPSEYRQFDSGSVWRYPPRRDGALLEQMRTQRVGVLRGLGL